MTSDISNEIIKVRIYLNILLRGREVKLGVRQGFLFLEAGEDIHINQSVHQIVH